MFIVLFCYARCLSGLPLKQKNFPKAAPQHVGELRNHSSNGGLSLSHSGFTDPRAGRCSCLSRRTHCSLKRSLTNSIPVFTELWCSAFMHQDQGCRADSLIKTPGHLWIVVTLKLPKSLFRFVFQICSPKHWVWVGPKVHSLCLPLGQWSVTFAFLFSLVNLFSFFLFCNLWLLCMTQKWLMAWWYHLFLTHQPNCFLWQLLFLWTRTHWASSKSSLQCSF